MSQKFTKNSKKIENNIIKIVKIGILVFVSFSVLGNFVPFFEGSNSYYYGIASILLVEKGATIPNPFLETYETNEFLVENWLRTNQNEMVPMSGHGLITLGGIFYFFGGYFGLYYLSPIFFIILLIVSERITTNLFGKYAGLIALILLSTSNLLFRNSIQFHTESLFCLMFILGAYFLIKFGRTNNSYLILLASVFFAISTTIRFSGLISFPIEFFILGVFIFNQYLTNKKKKENNEKQIIKKSFFSVGLALIPWVIFFLVFAYGNVSNFGEPVVIYGTLNESQDKYFDSSPLSLIEFEKTDFENVLGYSKYLLPYIFVGVFNNVENNFEDTFGQNWIGVIPLIILGLILVSSYKTSNKKLEMFVIILLIIGTIWFYSSITSKEVTASGFTGRYILPAFLFSSLMFGFAAEQIFSNVRKNNHYKSKIFQFSLVVILVIFTGISYNFTPAVTMLEQNNYFKNPFEYEREFPLKEDGISNDSIILSPAGARVQEYDLMSFRPSFTEEATLDSINLLQDIMEEGYDVYTFKIPLSYGEKDIIQSLIDKHGLILKDHSETFCKVEFSIDKNAISDENCINNEPIRKYGRSQN